MDATIKSVEEAFAAEPSLRQKIYSVVEQQPQHKKLFEDIGNFILVSGQRATNTSNGNDYAGEHQSKKRRLEDDLQATSNPNIQGPGTMMLEARDISFSLPQRKKLHLGFVEHKAQSGTQASYSIQLRNPATNQIDSKFDLSSYGYALRLPIPEKNQKQYNFCLLPAAGHLDAEPIIWTVNHGPLKSFKIDSDELKAIAAGPEDVLENVLNFAFKGTGVQLILPTEKEFASAMRESHRKSDVAYHVKAFRGSKEGYLFFLENGIFFGFKKPLNFFSFDEVDSVSYTSVLQRTFNLNITVRTGDDPISQDIEFSMIDQQDFAGIDAYVKRHRLQDASLAEARRAKKAGKSAKANDATADGDEEGRTELEKAQAEMEDEEDELEEDYDPEEGESDSGSESESSDEEYAVGKGRNLIAEELGSEAEDVSASEDEDDNDIDVKSPQPDMKPKSTSKPKTIAAPRAVKIPSHAVKPGRPAAPTFDDEDQL